MPSYKLRILHLHGGEEVSLARRGGHDPIVVLAERKWSERAQDDIFHIALLEPTSDA